MNVVILSGNFVRDPEIRYSTGEKPIAVANFTLAVARPKKVEGQPETDFINCVAFGKTGEVVEKWFKKGHRATVQGRWQTGSYTNKEKVKVFTSECIIEKIEFGQKRSEETATPKDVPTAPSTDGFMNIPDTGDLDLPFN